MTAPLEALQALPLDGGETARTTIAALAKSHLALLSGKESGFELHMDSAPRFYPAEETVVASMLLMANGKHAQAAHQLETVGGWNMEKLEARAGPFAHELEQVYGRALCGSGQPTAGKSWLSRSTDWLERNQHPASPFLAAARACLGQCVLKLGDRREAARLASLAKGAFEKQPNVSPYYKKPLLELQQQLAARSSN